MKKHSPPLPTKNASHSEVPPFSNPTLESVFACLKLSLPHEAKLAKELEQIHKKMPVLPDERAGGDPEVWMKKITEREDLLQKGIFQAYNASRERIAEKALHADHSFQILFAHTHLIDALHVFVFRVTIEELPFLVSIRASHLKKELEFKKDLLPKKITQLKALQEKTPEILEMEGNSEEKRNYFALVEKNLEGEINEIKKGLIYLKEVLPFLETFELEEEKIQEKMVLFARGGYGRGEMSFASDIDTGYCLDNRYMGEGEMTVFRELVMRVESQLNNAGIQTVHQYFEIVEDLSRFTDPETLHTITSILEARKLTGSDELLQGLKRKFYKILPYEPFLKKKTEEFETQEASAMTRMNLKNGQGGLRSIQIPLWIVGVTYKSMDFSPTALMTLAMEKGLFSPFEAAKFAYALELLYDLRNFSGAAVEFYDDEEAFASNLSLKEIAPNTLDDSLIRLYLFKRHRFETLDQIDTIRLRLMADTIRISQALLKRVLDQTLVHDLGRFQVAVHLGTNRIIHFLKEGKKNTDLKQLFSDSGSVMDLMCYLAESDYDLDDSLKDKMGEVVNWFKFPKSPEKNLAKAFRRLMLAPYSHRALSAMITIDDPFSEGMKTLLGRFIPQMDKTVFLLRDIQTMGVPLHYHLVESVAQAQKTLNWLKVKYPEFHAMLTPSHTLALKWSMLLHGIGWNEWEMENPIQSAEMAAEILNDLGFNDPKTEGLVRLMIQHHKTVMELARTAAYMDQALVRFFDIAGRQTVNVILLFLANLAALQARGGEVEGDIVTMFQFFEEGSRILAELQGIPDREYSLEVINVYLEQKKKELEGRTHLQLLTNKGLSQGLKKALYDPVSKDFPETWVKLAPMVNELNYLERRILLGDLEESERDKLVDKLNNHLRSHIQTRTLEALTEEETEVFYWFFASFPNRYLLGTTPKQLADQMHKFSNFQRIRARAEVVVGSQGSPEGILIYTRTLENSHSKVAFALSRKELNIISGKVNRVELHAGDHGYCYYFQFTPLSHEYNLFPRDIEGMILEQTLPDLQPPSAASAFIRRGIRVEFIGDDGKGYIIEPEGKHYMRRNFPYFQIRVTVRDQPNLFLKLNRAFDIFKVEVFQSLVTTTGNQVVDQFYVAQKDYERLRDSNFEETFIGMIEQVLDEKAP